MSDHDIFLSYNREDTETAKRVANGLAAHGYNVWWDVILRSGETYDAVTEQALRDARAVVVLWSRRSVNSRWVRAEATVADRQRKLVPAMIEPCDRPIMFELTQTADLTRWQGSSDDPSWRAFLSDLAEMISAQRAPVVQRQGGAQPNALVQPSGQPDGTPTLAVLPFTNRSLVAEDEVFAFGMVEDIIDALSQSANIRVLSSSGVARHIRAGIPDLGAIGEQLGARYVLEGNSRRFGTDLRVTAQLLNTADGAILWSRKFDRPLDRLAELQEELVLQVASSLGAQVMQLELDRVLQKPSDLTAWEAIMRALAWFREISDTSIMRGLEEAERAIAIAPDYGPAHGMLAAVKGMVLFEVSPEDDTLKKEVLEHAQKAIALAPNHAFNLVCASEAMSFIGNAAEGLRLAERALKINNRVTEGHLARGIANALLGRFEDAIRDYRTEIEIWPNYHTEFSTLGALALAYLAIGNREEAMAAILRSRELNPADWHSQAILAVLLGLKGEHQAAIAALDDALSLGGIDSLERAQWPIVRAFGARPVPDEVLKTMESLWAHHSG